MKKRKHGKRSLIYKLQRVKSNTSKKGNAIIERDARMLMALATFAMGEARKFILRAERITARTL